jgi:hypothetical protein
VRGFKSVSVDPARPHLPFPLAQQEKDGADAVRNPEGLHLQGTRSGVYSNQP